jgi:DnaJ domain
MTYLIAGGAALGVLLLLARAFIAADPRALVRAVRYGLGISFIGVGALLGLGGRWGVGLVLATLGLSAITAGRIGPFDLGGSSRSSGSASTVRSRYLEMRLDHDSGDMTGRVLGGEQAGRALDELIDRELLALRDEIAGDPESLALLEAYLDRRISGWREHVEGDTAAGTGGAADPGAMTDEEAYEILGLAPGAGEAEIRAAHRRLMKRVHPDQGGSTFLAAKINQAKDWLLSKHR